MTFSITTYIPRHCSDTLSYVVHAVTCLLLLVSALQYVQHWFGK